MRAIGVELLEQLLPFHILVDEQMRISSVGSSLARVSQVCEGQQLADAIEVDVPVTLPVDSWADLAAADGTAVRVSVVGSAIKLRGQIVALDDCVLMAGTVVIDTPQRLSEWGLLLSDFAAQDAGPDLALLEQLRGHTEEQLRETVEHLASVLATNEELRKVELAMATDFRIAAEIKLRVDENDQIIDFGHGSAYISGTSTGEFVGRALRSVIPSLAQAVGAARAAGGREPLAEVVQIEGPERTAWMDTRIAIFDDGTALVVGRDITDQRNQQEVLQHRALHDPLTGLANRRLFWDRIAGGLTPDREHRLAVIVIDLDGFKAVNDVFGHGAGDEVLQTMSARIRECVRGHDTVARLGGDEFGVLLEGVSSASQVDEIARRIVARAEEPILADGYSVSVSATLGVVMGGQGATVDTLVRDADLAMYQARSDGREKQVGWFAANMREAVDERRRLTDDLVDAVRSRSLSVHYQPIIELATRSVTGFEALARWDHPTRGPISPEIFIELAEQSRHIGELDRLVMQIAIEQQAAWTAELGVDTVMSMNLSPLSLVPTLGRDLEALMSRVDLGDSRIAVEITETSLLTDLTSAEEILADLARRGIRIALDDFGTGYSSLTHLYRLPIRMVKIDRSFVANVDNREHHARRLVEASVAMAAATGADVVAEGVETEAQAAAVAELGCRYGQGYLFGRPMPADQAVEFLRQKTLAPTAQS